MNKYLITALSSVLLLSSCEDLFSEDSETTNNSTPDNSNSALTLALTEANTKGIIERIDLLSSFDEDGFYSFDTPERLKLFSGETGALNIDCENDNGHVSLNIVENQVNYTVTNKSIYTQCERFGHELNGEMDYLFTFYPSTFNTDQDVTGTIDFKNLSDNSTFTLKNYSQIHDNGSETIIESFDIEFVNDSFSGILNYESYEDEATYETTITITGANNSEFKAFTDDQYNTTCTLNSMTVDCATYSFN